MAYQYPYGDTQQLNLAWFLDEFKALQEAWEQEKQGITGALDAEIARAEAALSGVIEARDQAAASAADALAYRNAAQSASQAAELSKTNAETARRDAANYAVSAAGSAQNASNSAIAAGNSATLAESAKTTAIQQANAAVQASGAASGHAQTAGQEAANAAASATAAAGSATTAGEEADRAEEAADEVADSVTQIATNTSDINSLKESINTTTSNLLDFNGIDSMWLQGTLSSPNVPYACYSDFYDITDNAKYVWATFNAQKYLSQFPTYTNGNVGIQFYDENKETTGSFYTALLQFEGPNQITIPSNAKFYKLQISSTRYNDTITPSDLSTGNAFGYIGVDKVEPANILPKYSTQPNYNNQKNNITNALIAKTVTEMTADQILYANDFRIVNGTLYRITTTIQSGATLVPNTNCVQTTISDALKTLLG